MSVGSSLANLGWQQPKVGRALPLSLILTHIRWTKSPPAASCGGSERLKATCNTANLPSLASSASSAGRGRFIACFFASGYEQDSTEASSEVANAREDVGNDKAVRPAVES